MNEIVEKTQWLTQGTERKHLSQLLQLCTSHFPVLFVCHRRGNSTYVIERTFILLWSSTKWTAILRQEKFTNSRNRLGVQRMGLFQPLRHRQALAPPISCHPFLTRMGPQAHELPLASVWVFSFAFHVFKYRVIVIEQTAHSLGVSTSVSALEISDLSPVSVPTAGANLVQHVLNNHLTTVID